MQRYAQDFEFEPSRIIKCDDGPYVLYSDHLAEMEAEKKRWERQEGIRALKYHETLKAEIAALKERKSWRAQ